MREDKRGPQIKELLKISPRSLTKVSVASEFINQPAACLSLRGLQLACSHFFRTISHPPLHGFTFKQEHSVTRGPPIWLSNLISLKVTDWSNTMRITSFTHYRPIRSPVDTGSLCTLSAKPSRGSTLHTSETNYTLKGDDTWNTERSFLQSKAFV